MEEQSAQLDRRFLKVKQIAFLIQCTASGQLGRRTSLHDNVPDKDKSESLSTNSTIFQRMHAFYGIASTRYNTEEGTSQLFSIGGHCSSVGRAEDEGQSFQYLQQTQPSSKSSCLECKPKRKS